MNTSIFESRILTVRRLVALFGLATAFALFGGAGCAGGGEGDRCIPSPPFSHNDCNGDLVCTTIVDPATGATCGESYCCKADGTSTNSNCNPSLIAPAPDGAAGICPVPPSATATMPLPEAGTEAGEGGSSGD